jgi:hypothetical protein
VTIPFNWLEVKRRVLDWLPRAKTVLNPARAFCSSRIGNVRVFTAMTAM